MNQRGDRQLLLLTAYAVAMALLEAAVVVYMRRLYYPDRPLDLFPLTFLERYDPVLELAREVATIVMLVTVAWLAERRSLTRKFAAFVFTFGLWDLSYYAWLKILLGWPRSWWEWDVLFLIPGVWLGPWICPATIAFMFVIWGFWGMVTRVEPAFTKAGVILFVSGAGIGLLTFLQPSVASWLLEGRAMSTYTPGEFWWWLFVPSVLMMAAGFATTLPISESATGETQNPRLNSDPAGS